MARGKRPSIHVRSKRHLNLESLERREMLASDLGVQAGYNNDPFAHDAFTVEELTVRAQDNDYRDDQLVVTFSFDSLSSRDSTAITDEFWNSQISDGVESWETSMEYVRDNGTTIVMTDLTLADGIDPVDAMKQIEHPNIVWSSPIFLFGGENPQELIPNDPRYFEQYHHDIMSNDLAWDFTLGDSDIIVAVTDDGVDLSHQDLQSNIWTNTGEVAGDGIDNDGNGYADDINGWDFINGNNRPDPDEGDHGTHVAGIAAAGTDDGIGVAGTAGNSTIMPIQFYNYGDWPADVIRDSYFYAADNGAQIVTTSYNIDGWVGDPVFTAGVQYAVDNGMLYLNSAGNGSSSNPARQAFEQPLLVASTTDTDSISDFSNVGTGIDISAPGSDILSTIRYGDYDFFSGTSMATPNAAGVAALIWAQNPTWTNFQVAAQLIGTADSIDAQNPGFVGQMGGGRVNSFNALTQSLSAPKIDGTVGVPSNGATTEDVSISSFEVEFDRVLDPATAMDSTNYTLINLGLDGVAGTADDESIPITVASMYMPGSNSVELAVTGGSSLEVGEYRLAVVSGGITDPFGQALDGDGDGVAGGDFETFFSVINPFKSNGPDPSLIAKRTERSASLSNATDTDTVKFYAEAGETITAIATPTDSSAKLTLEVSGLASDTATNAGDRVILELSSIPADGEYDFVVSGDAGTNYSLDIYKNVNIEGLIEGGIVDLESSELSLGSSRFAAIASADGVAPGINFSQYSSPGLFVDISSTGTALGLSDDGEADIFTSIGNSLMPSGNMTIGNNGALVEGAGVAVGFTNGGLPETDFAAALMPFWDDIDSDTGDVYWEERVVGGIDTLIVQWHDRPHYSNVGNSTFQLQLFDTGPVLARYAYQDVDFSDPTFDNGASATIGAQASATEGFEYSFNQAIVSNGDVIDIIEGTPSTDVDEFTATFPAGATIDVILDGNVDRFEDAVVELVDPSGSVVATASAGSGPFDLGIVEYQTNSSGEYTVRVSAGFPGEYHLIVTEDLAYDVEPNDSTSSARDITDEGAAFGFLSGDSIQLNQYSDASLFVDISFSGTPLGLSDDGEATIFTTVGNDAFPAGEITIGNNGVVISGSGDVGFTNGALPETDWDTALVPFWDDIDDSFGDVYYQETVINGINALVVQWDQRPHYSDIGSATFQVQVFESGPVPIRYVYDDVSFEDPAFDFGASATVGFQTSSSNAETFSQNTASLSNGDVIDVSTASVDMYSFDVSTGDEIQISTSTPFDSDLNEPLNNTLDLALEIQDAFGNVLASDLNSAADGRNAVVTYTATSTETLYIAVTQEAGFGEYVVSVSAPTGEVDGDFNDDGAYDCNDINALTTSIANAGNDGSFDLTGDGLVDTADLDAWLAEAGNANGLGASYLLGDADLDGAVDVTDFNAWNANKFTVNSNWCDGDFTADGVVDVSDFAVWNTNKFTTALRSSDISPEVTNEEKAERDTQASVVVDVNNTPVRLVTATAAPSGRVVGRAQLIDSIFASHEAMEEDKEEVSLFSDLN